MIAPVRHLTQLDQARRARYVYVPFYAWGDLNNNNNNNNNNASLGQHTLPCLVKTNLSIETTD